MNNIKAERMKSDLKRGLSQVFLKRGLSYVLFTDVYISSDYRYAKIEIDVIKKDLAEVVNQLNSAPLHGEIIKDLHHSTKIRNFPKIKFMPDSHKERIEEAEKILSKIHSDLLEF